VRLKTMPPAGALRLRDGGDRTRVPAGGVWRWGLPSRLPSTQAEPSRHGTGRPGRSYSGALHLDARHRARSTVCGSTADGMGVWGGGAQNRMVEISADKVPANNAKTRAALGWEPLPYGSLDSLERS
jgi:hypothetical protein